MLCYVMLDKWFTLHSVISMTLFCRISAQTFFFQHAKIARYANVAKIGLSVTSFIKDH